MKTALLKAVIIVFLAVFSFNMIGVHEDMKMIALYDKSVRSTVMVYDVRDYQGNHNASVGSGVFLTKTTIITNNHVVESNKDNLVEVKVDYKDYDAVVVYRNPAFDIAILEIKEPIGRPIVVNYVPTIIGERVISIGTSFAKPYTLGVGYVTGVERAINLAPFYHLASISTGIEPGNSGGGVFNMRGELVGISFAGVSGGDNVGFMIPTALIYKIIEHYKI